MNAIIIAIILLLVCSLLIFITIRSMIRLRSFGLLNGFLRKYWIPCVLTSTFILQFIIIAIALLLRIDWAIPMLRLTFQLWLLYLWLYTLQEVVRLSLFLQLYKTGSLSQFAGRSPFFDQLIEASIEMSKNSNAAQMSETEGGNAQSDPSWEDLLEDENFFQRFFPYAVKKRIKKKGLGLMIHTMIVLLFLFLI